MVCYYTLYSNIQPFEFSLSPWGFSLIPAQQPLLQINTWSILTADSNWCWWMLIDSDWCWLMLTYTGWCWLIPIDSNWCWLMLTNADWRLLMLIDADWGWLIAQKRLTQGRIVPPPVVSPVIFFIQLPCQPRLLANEILEDSKFQLQKQDCLKVDSPLTWGRSASGFCADVKCWRFLKQEVAAAAGFSGSATTA